MSTQLLNPTSEAEIWARLLRAIKRPLSAETAEYLLSVTFQASDQERMEELAERSQDGTLTDQEGAEFDCYLHIANFLAVMHSKARSALQQQSEACRRP